MIWLLISRRRSHRGGREWHLYRINTITRVYEDGNWYYIVGRLTGCKRAGNHQSFCVKAGSLLWSSFRHYFMVRGPKRSDALFLAPLDRWIV